jgi:phosphopantothenoylcysteine synthetase/decarboxylase
MSNVVASPIAVRAYLVRHYHVTDEQAAELVHNYADRVQTDSNIGSFAYYTGDYIATEENLSSREDEDDDLDDDDDDDDDLDDDEDDDFDEDEEEDDGPGHADD